MPTNHEPSNGLRHYICLQENNLRAPKASTLLWLYEDIGLDVSLILLIVQYAVTHNKANIRFIEQTAVDWVNKGIDNLTDAEEQLRLLSESEIAWNIVLSAFGIERRKPSKKEIELSLLWVNEWKISKELLIAAYDECINHKAKLSFPYIAKIIENWQLRIENSAVARCFFIPIFSLNHHLTYIL